jgi:cell division protein FtsB
MAGKRVTRWSLLIAGSGALLLFVGVSTVRESYREWKIDQEIRGLESQIESLEGKKFRLAELIQRLQSEEAVDREARMRLGMHKPGERVIVLKGGEFGDATWNDALPAPPSEPVREQSNPQKWFRYFFHD